MTLIACTILILNKDVIMNMKLEQRIKRLERLVCRKNESVEMSPAEMKAYKAVKDAINALKEAEEACYDVELDDMWYSDNWDNLGHDCDTALSYLPTDGEIV